MCYLLRVSMKVVVHEFAECEMVPKEYAKYVKEYAVFPILSQRFAHD